jgi:RNA polymerase sigma factor (sigma-70 family)
VIGPEATLPQLESDDFVECYQAHYPRLVRALVLSGAPVTVAEDLAQEAFARMLTHWHRVRAGSSPAGYAYRSAFRLLLRGRRARGAGGQALVEGGPSVAGPEAAVTLRVSAAAALAAMPARRRACAVMCLVVGLSTRDAASALGIAEGTVRKHLAEARNDLRDLLTS